LSLESDVLLEPCERLDSAAPLKRENSEVVARLRVGGAWPVGRRTRTRAALPALLLDAVTRQKNKGRAKGDPPLRRLSERV
jgi:hypothetical protein